MLASELAAKAVENDEAICVSTPDGDDAIMVSAETYRDMQDRIARLEDYLEATVDTRFETDAENRLVYVSENYKEITGIDPAEFVGKTRQETMVSGVDPHVRKRHMAELEAQLPYRDFRHFRTHRDGRQIEFSISGKPVFDDKGDFQGYRGTGTDVTSREGMSMGILETTLGALDVGVVIFDQNMCFILCNDSYRDMFPEIVDILVPGTPLETLHETAARRIMGLTDADEIRKFCEERRRVYSSPDNVKEQVRLEGRVLVQTHKRISRGWTVGVRSDITQLVEAQQGLEASEQRLLDAIESIPDGFILFDEDERISMVNHRYKEIYDPDWSGWPGGTIIGRTLEEHLRAGVRDQNLFPDAKDREDEFIAERLKGIRGQSDTYVHQIGNGKWVRVSNRRTRDGGIVGLRSDISTQVEREHILETAQRVARIGFWRRDIGNRYYTEWSEEMYRIYGLDPETMVPDVPTIDSMIHPDDLQRVEDTVSNLGDHTDRFSFEYRITRMDGSQGVVAGEAEVQRNETGAPIALFGVSQDVTQLREHEERLRQAQKMESVGQLTGGVAHDFNNLLAVVLGNLELMSMFGETDKKMAKLIDTARRATERGAMLTQRLLAFSRRQVLRPTSLNLNDSVEGMLDLLKRTLGAPIHIRTELDGNLWFTRVDSSQIENAILNLALNSRDAMDRRGQVTIRTCNRKGEALIGLEEVKRNQDYVEISVSDNGHGIPADVREKVLEPFFTTKDVGEGSGLGLSMVYGFVNQSGGVLRIEDNPGGGALIRLLLPRAEAEEGPGHNVSRQTSVTGDGERVLVIEDDQEVREVAVSILEASGYKVFFAKDGPTALATYDIVAPVDLVLSDVILPGGLYGPEIVKSLQKKTPDLRYAYMSGHADPVHLASLTNYDQKKILNKPFTSASLTRHVSKLLKGGK